MTPDPQDQADEIWWNRGVDHHRRGEWSLAEACYRRIHPANPIQGVVLGNLGAIALQTGRIDEAVGLLRQAAALRPGDARILANLGLATAGQSQQAPPLQPDHVATLCQLGHALMDQGRLDEAATYYRQVLTLRPDHVEALVQLGNALGRSGRSEAAEAIFRQALALDPDSVVILSGLGAALIDLGQLDEAEACCRRAITLAPHALGALTNLGALLCTRGRLNEAEACCRQVLARQPDHVAALFNLGKIHLDREEPDRAAACYRQILAHQPDYADALANLGSALVILGQLDEAETCCRQALALRPDDKGALTALGTLLLNVGQPNEARACLEKASAPRPEPSSRDARLAGQRRRILRTSQLYQPDLTPAELFHQTRRYAETFPAPPAPGFPDHAFDPEKRLRIGYLSSDFCDHPIAHNLLPLLSHHARQDHEVFCYALGYRRDAVTERLRSLAHRWQAVAGHSDETIAALLREDRLDLLVLLAGHFDANRPELCRYRAAPVQVSFHDGTSSGFPEMDGWLTDSFLHPDDAGPEQFTEQLYRLPCFYQFEPPSLPLDSWEPPADHHGFVTFGSFNNPAKINDSVLDCWATLLQRLPTSRLRLKYRNLFGNARLRQRVVQRFARHGVAEERLLLWPEPESLAQHLSHHRVMDIALDPFPFNGATTTFQALSMGVPVIALLGDRFLGRVGASLLHHLQTPELIASTRDDYIAKAVALANDRERLRNYHRWLPQKVLDSPLCQGKEYAASVMTAFRELWHRRCRQTTREGDAGTLRIPPP